MVHSCSPVPMSNSPPVSFTSKGKIAQVSKSGCNLTTEYKPQMVSQHNCKTPTNSQL